MMYYDAETNMEQMVPFALEKRLRELGLDDQGIRLFCGYIKINHREGNIYTVERLVLGRGYDRQADSYACWAAREFHINVEKLNPYYDQYR